MKKLTQLEKEHHSFDGELMFNTNEPDGMQRNYY
jgi:hypothetical protein